MNEKDEIAETAKSGNRIQSQDRGEGGTQTKSAAQCGAGRVVWIGNDGFDRLVGGRADTGRRGVRHLARPTLSGKSFVDIDAVNCRSGDWLHKRLVLGFERRKEIREQQMDDE